MVAQPAQRPLTPLAERLAILALASAAFAMTLNANVLAALLPYLEADSAFAGHDLKILVGAAGLAGAVGAVLLGPAVDAFGRRTPMTVGMLLFTLASLWHVLAAGSFAQILAARALAGFAAGVTYTSASAAVADLVAYERRGAAMGVFTAGMFLAVPVGLPLAGLFARLGHWSHIFVVQAGVGVLAMLAIRMLIPRDLGRSRYSLDNLRMLGTVDVIACLGSVVLYVGAFFTSVQFAGAWLDRSGLLPKKEQGMLWVVLGLCMAVGSLALARLSDRFGKRTWTNLTCVGVAAFLLLLTRVDDLAGLWAVGLPLAIVAAARTGPFQALISELVPTEARGTLMGVRAAAVNLGTGVFPMLAPKDYHDALYVASAAVFVAFLLVLLLVRQR
ncbi:MAG: MFS transporter [Planctomycetes bacterium]|nr:MFS transporter [Planctomycetota bacterium]